MALGGRVRACTIRACIRVGASVKIHVFASIAVFAASILIAAGSSSAEDGAPSSREIQQALSDHGFDIGVVDGKWGKRSEKALQAFQKANGLTPSGAPELATLRKLLPQRFGLRSEMARPIDKRTEPLLDRTTGETITLFRLARTGIGRCHVLDFDLGKISARLRTRFADRYDELVAAVDTAGDREASGLAFLDEAYHAQPCAEWSTTARSFGLVVAPPPAPVVSAPPPRPVIQSPPLAAYRPSSTGLPWGYFVGAGFVLSGLIWRRSRRNRSNASSVDASTTISSQGSGTQPTASTSSRAANTTEAASSPSGETLAQRLSDYDRVLAEAMKRHADDRSIAREHPEAIAVVPMNATAGAEVTSADVAALAVMLDDHSGVVSEATSRRPFDQRVTSPAEAITVAPNAPPELVPGTLSGRGRRDERIAHERPTNRPSLASMLEEHKRMVAEARGAPVGARAHEPLPDVARPSVGGKVVGPVEDRLERSSPQTLMLPETKGATWIAAGQSVTIGSHIVTKGMIWVGNSLARQNDRFTNENCLIDPKLPIASRADVSGQYLPYWPSYGDIAPSSRKAYLDWLAGPRSDPTINIGYVFLYFYGLERRLMLEATASDRDEIRAEISRLLGIYGENHSFRRYAVTLLSAEAIRFGGLVDGPIPEFGPSGFEVPLELRIALGLRVRDGRPIEPELLLAFVLSHPETRLRTPARRAASELRELFTPEVVKAFPKGVKVGGASRIRKLVAPYRAASGTFEIDLLPPNHGLPDISGLSEPLGAARRILDDCTDRLDAYSRELGRSDGLRPTLSAVAKLPLPLRMTRVGMLPENPFGILTSLAETGEPITVTEFGSRLGFTSSGAINKGRLREWSTIAGALGFGLTCDPSFSLRSVKPDEPTTVFTLEAENDGLPAPSDAFRRAQVSIALAMMVALADGRLDPSEQQALLAMVARAEGVTADERRRLIAEIRVQAANPHGLADLKARLKEAPVEARERLGDEIVAIAAADGIVDAREVALLEKLFRQMDLDGTTLYSRLHGGATAGAPASSGGEGAMVSSDTKNEASTMAPSGAASAIDPTRLAAIRRETAGTTSVLSEIFAEDEDVADEAPVAESPAVNDGDDGCDGLDGRHRSLVGELIARPEWPRVDFERLVRDIGLMPGAAIETLNDWALDRFDDCLLEGDDPIIANLHLLPESPARVSA